MSRIMKCKICEEEKELCAKGMCQKCYHKKYKDENKDHIKEKRREYREENKEQLKEWSKKHYEENRENILEYAKSYYKENPEFYREKSRNWRYAHGSLPASENRSCAPFLGVHVAEKVLSKVFKNVKRMPPNHSGYDFRCSKGMKVDVKSSTLHKGESWSFNINKNKIADYFLCLAFDNITDLNPLYMWLIPGETVSYLTKTGISSATLVK